jgi:4-methyl-5(b-hydroxyethyl)-thiazole monophosphate biosynthesis
MDRHVLVPIANGTEELEAVTIIDTLRRAGARVTVASVEEGLQVIASRRVRLVADKLIKDCLGNTYDLIVLPGGLVGAEHLRDSEHLVSILKKQNQDGRLIAAICASPAVVLAHHGLIGSRRACAYPGFEDSFDNKVAFKERVVVDGNFITSKGPGSALEFSLKLAEVLFGKEKSKKVADEMLVI